MISACLIVKDEEQTIGDCLRSIRPFVQEIVVLDTGSTDATVTIARERGADVYTTEWTNHFADARNLALARATQPFILVIDADERLVAQDATRLAEHCLNWPDMVGSVTVRNVQEHGSHTTGDSAYPSLRLFPNRPEFRYSGRIHEQLLEAGRAPNSRACGVELLHLGYIGEQRTDKDRLTRNLQLLQLELQDSPDDPYLLYQIGRTFQVGEAHSRAVEYLTAAFDALRQRVAPLPLYASSILLQLAYAWKGLRQLQPTIEVLSLGTQLYPDFTDLYFAYGTTLLEVGSADQLEDVRLAFESCLQLGEADAARYESVIGVGSFRALYNLGAFHEATSSGEIALEYYRRSAAFGFEPAVQRLHALGRAA